MLQFLFENRALLELSKPYAISFGLEEALVAKMRILKTVLLLLVFCCFSFVAVAEDIRPVFVIEINTSISPASDDFLKSSLAKARAANAKLLIIKINTPGGLLPSMQSMVEHLLQSKTPTASFIYPSGGAAISAGVFVAMAANYAAMAPGTTIGAATPVQSGGQDIPGDMKAKVENFAASLAKAVAEQRGRNLEWAEKAVREANSITDREAVEKKVVDFSAKDVDDLLTQLEGKVVKLPDGETRLIGLKTSPLQSIPMTFKQKVLNVLMDPNVAILLGLGALLGLGIEFYHPGLVLPGVVGLICLILALSAAAILPINYGGVALMLLAVAFFIAEFFMPSFGALGIAGIVCLILGAIYLIDTDMVWTVEGFQVDKLFIGAVAATVGSLLLIVCLAVLRTLRSKITTGTEGMIGQIATVQYGFSEASNFCDGHVTIRGELWKARLENPATSQLRSGEKVKVLRLDGLVLSVQPLSDTDNN